MDERPDYRGILEVEVDADNNINTDLPTWMRDAIDRALGETGIRIGGGKKLASEEVIENLKELRLEDLESDSLDCPICFDKYVESKLASDLKKDSPTDAPDGHSSTAIFNDPALYFPVVESASIYTRYPPKCLETKVDPTKEEMFPDINKSERNKPKKAPTDEEIIHSPVKMPGCNHIFGKTCIIEWLKNNVSCPLCRKEVAAESRDPKVIKLKEVRQQSSFQYVDDEESEAKHIAERLTDIFHPFKRPYNSNVTPLTDRYIPQEWSRPQHSWEQERADGIDLNVPDPSLVLLRKYPLGGMSELPRRSLSTTNMDNGPTGDDLFDLFLNRETSAARDEVNNLREPLLSRPLQSILRGRGGPERSNRGPSRGHPYSRPDEP